MFEDKLLTEKEIGEILTDRDMQKIEEAFYAFGSFDENYPEG